MHLYLGILHPERILEPLRIFPFSQPGPQKRNTEYPGRDQERHDDPELPILREWTIQTPIPLLQMPSP